MIINYNDFNDINDLMNALLDKISNDGFDKLTDEEKDLLNKISNGEDINLEKLKNQPSTPSETRQSTPKKFGGFNLVDGDGQPLGKIPRPPKKFDIGDEVYPLTKSGDNLPSYATQFLNTKDKFTVLKINSSGKIDIGCHRHTDEGKKKVFYYSTNRFTTIDPSTQIDSDFDDGLVGNGGGFNNNNDDIWDRDNKVDNVPNDYLFAVSDNYEAGMGDGDICVYLTAYSYYRRENCLDDRLGGHNLSTDVKRALRRVGVSTTEDMEAVFGVRNRDLTKEDIVQGLIDEGFRNDPGFRGWLENDEEDYLN